MTIKVTPWEPRTPEEISTWWNAIDEAAANAPDFPSIRYSHARVKELMRVYGKLIKQRETAMQALANALREYVEMDDPKGADWTPTHAYEPALAALDAARKAGFIQ